MAATIELSLALVAALLLVLINTGAVAMVVLQLPGTWLMLTATAAFALWRRGDVTPGIGLGVLVGMLLLAIVGEVLETVAAAYSSRKAGGTKTGAILAIVFGFLGAVLGVFVPVAVVGSIAGACIGAGIGSIVGDVMRGRALAQAGIAGRGAAVGKLWGTLAKIVIALIMWTVATVALVWP